MMIDERAVLYGVSRVEKSGKQLFTVSSTKDRGVVASLIVNMGLVFAEMKKKVLLIDVNFSDPKLHVLLQSDHDNSKRYNKLFPCNYESFLVICLNTYIVFLQKTVHTGTPLVAMDEFDNAIAKWKEDFDYIFFYSSEVFDLPATHIIAGNAME